jgi:hypothetical protein
MEIKVVSCNFVTVTVQIDMSKFEAKGLKGDVLKGVEFDLGVNLKPMTQIMAHLMAAIADSGVCMPVVAAAATHQLSELAVATAHTIASAGGNTDSIILITDNRKSKQARRSGKEST